MYSCLTILLEHLLLPAHEHALYIHFRIPLASLHYTISIFTILLVEVDVELPPQAKVPKRRPRTPNE